jgi:hypothetical protein
MYICTYVYMYMCICLYVYICTYVYMHMCICVYMYLCMCVYMYMCICIYDYLCIYVSNMGQCLCTGLKGFTRAQTCVFFLYMFCRLSLIFGSASGSSRGISEPFRFDLFLRLTG